MCQTQTFRHSFDHFVCTCEHRRPQCKAERFCGLEIDHKLVLGWRLHRKVGWLLAL